MNKINKTKASSLKRLKNYKLLARLSKKDKRQRDLENKISKESSIE